MRKLLAGVFGVAVFAAASASAESYYWTGAVNDVWDTTTANWAKLSDGKACTWPRPSNTIFDTSKFAAGSSLTITKGTSESPYVQDLLLNVEQDKELTIKLSAPMWDNNQGTQSIQKTGAGQCTVSSSGNKALFLVSKNTVHIKEGTLKVISETTEALGRVGVTKTAEHSAWHEEDGRVKKAHLTEYNIYPGAAFWIAARSMLGSFNYGSGVRIRVQDGGTLKVGPRNAGGNMNCNTADELILEGGTVAFEGDGSETYGMLGAGSLLKLTGTKACTLDAGGNSTRGFMLGYGGNTYDNMMQFRTPPEINVADVTGDSKVDLDINMPISRNDCRVTNMVSFVKTGAGTLRFSYGTGGASTEKYGVNGNLKIMEGEVQFYGIDGFHQNLSNTVYVSTNATLTFATLAPSAPSSVNDGRSSTKYHFDHGKFVLDPAIANAGGHQHLGYMWLGQELVMENSQIESYVLSYSGNTENGLEALMAGDLVHIKAVPGESWAADWTARDPSIAHQNLQVNAPYTEFRVEDTTGSDEVDMTNGFRLVNFHQHAVAAGESSCLLKTGDGTLMLTNKLNNVDSIEVRAGTLLVKNPASTKYNDYVTGYTTKSYLGNNAAANGSVRVMTNGVLKLDKNCQYAITSFEDGSSHLKRVKRPLIIDGGKVDITGNAGNGWACMQPFGPVTMMNGGRIDYTNNKINLGPIAVHGKFKVCGTEPIELPAVSEGGFGRIFIFPNYQTEFDIEDVTGDLATDFTTYLCPGMPGNDQYFDGTDESRGKGQLGDTWWYGWTKTGAGTMELKHCDAERFHTLPAIVSNGTLVVSANFNRSVTLNKKTHTCAGFEVRSGAYIGGTGTVASVTLEAGAGLFATEDQAVPLTSQAAVAIPASGTIVIKATPGQSGFALRNVRVLASPNGFVDADNLSNWTISIPGYTNPDVSLVRKGNTLCATTKRGMVMFVK